MGKAKHLEVSAIQDGTVIDHIPADSLFKVINLLGLNQRDEESLMTFGTNLESKRLGKKAIIKIEGKVFQDEEVNRVALVAPTARMNTIKGYEVVDKHQVVVPDQIRGIVKCVNPKCITNNENVQTCFKVISKEVVALKCKYCEKVTNQDEIEIVN